MEQYGALADPRPMLAYNFEQCLGYILCATAQAMQNALNEELRQENLTFRQWQVLACLASYADRELSQSTIADLLGIEGATLVGVLDRMERDGWIVRQPCPQDRRRKKVRPAERIHGVWDRAVGCAQRVRDRALQGLSPTEVDTLWELLQRVQQNMNANLTSVNFDECGETVGAPSTSASSPATDSVHASSAAQPQVTSEH